MGVRLTAGEAGGCEMTVVGFIRKNFDRKAEPLHSLKPRVS